MTPLQLSDWELHPHSCPGLLRHETVSHLEAGETLHHTEYLHIRTSKQYGLMNIQSPLEGVLSRSDVQDGLCFISTHHITTGIYVNDAESGLLEDLSKWLDQIAPYGLDYRHHQTGEDNCDAHIKSLITNHEITVPITQGRFDFGTWQQVFYAEFDGRREKRIVVKIIGLK